MSAYWLINWRASAMALAIVVVVAGTLWLYRVLRRRLGFRTWAEHARFYQVTWGVALAVEIVIGLLLLSRLILG